MPKIFKMAGNVSPSVRLETITTNKAAEYIARNKGNRPYKPYVTAKYTKAMLNGEWALNGETIKFNVNGDLIDGQHRLGAVIESGVTIQCYVMRGLPLEAYDTLDQGKPRGLDDILARAGRKNYKTLATAVRWIEQVYLQKSLGGARRQGGVYTGKTNKELHDLADSLVRVDDSVSYIIQRDMAQLGNCGMLAAMHWIFAKKDRSAADLFFKKVCIGEEIVRTDPEYKVRKAFLDDNSSVKKMLKGVMCSMLIQAWNSRRSGVPLKKFTDLSDFELPEVA